MFTIDNNASLSYSNWIIQNRKEYQNMRCVQGKERRKDGKENKKAGMRKQPPFACYISSVFILCVFSPFAQSEIPSSSS